MHLAERAKFRVRCRCAAFQCMRRGSDGGNDESRAIGASAVAAGTSGLPTPAASAAFRMKARSASRFATRERKDWARLLADLAAGRFGVLMLWEASRGDRDAPELIDVRRAEHRL